MERWSRQSKTASDEADDFKVTVASVSSLRGNTNGFEALAAAAPIHKAAATAARKRSRAGARRRRKRKWQPHYRGSRPPSHFGWVFNDPQGSREAPAQRRVVGGPPPSPTSGEQNGPPRRVADAARGVGARGDAGAQGGDRSVAP